MTGNEEKTEKWGSGGASYALMEIHQLPGNLVMYYIPWNTESAVEGEGCLLYTAEEGVS